MQRRRIAVITVSRADWGPLRPVARALRDDPRTQLVLIATGGHLDPAQGLTIGAIERDGFRVDERVALPASAMADEVGVATAGLAAALRRAGPDAVVVLGDRYETLAAATAAVCEGLRLVHIHGGEVTTGAIDNKFRDAISMLADLHCTATVGARARLVGMGIEPSRVVVTGAPGLDELDMSDEALARARASFPGRFLLVTVHPETAGETHVDRVIAALDRAGLPCVITGANSDPGGETINAAWREAVKTRPGWTFEMNLGVERYRAAMATALCMVGNSSSGIIEAASFGLPVVNIGERQGGRERSGNVVDVPWEAGAIVAAIGAATRFQGENVYGDGRAAGRIVEVVMRINEAC